MSAERADGTSPPDTGTNVVASVETPATAINEEHRLARACLETAVQHALRCGQLLIEQKQRLGHGKFERWVRTTLDFSERTARVYMQAARQNGSALPISLRALLAPPTDAKDEVNEPRRPLKRGHSRSAVNRQRAEHERLPRGPRSCEQIADTLEQLVDRGITPAQWLDELPGYTVSRARSQMARVHPWLEGLCHRLESQGQPTPPPATPAAAAPEEKPPVTAGPSGLPAMRLLGADWNNDPTAQETRTVLERALRDRRTPARLAQLLVGGGFDDLVGEELLEQVQLQRLTRLMPRRGHQAEPVEWQQ